MTAGEWRNFIVQQAILLLGTGTCTWQMSTADALNFLKKLRFFEATITRTSPSSFTNCTVTFSHLLPKNIFRNSVRFSLFSCTWMNTRLRISMVRIYTTCTAIQMVWLKQQSSMLLLTLHWLSYIQTHLQSGP